MPSSKIAERQKFIKYWKDKTGNSEVDMHEVAKLAIKMGWVAPAPITEEDRLAKLFKTAARQDIRHDNKTGHPYRGYHAVPKFDVNGQACFFYVDIDDPKTKPKSFHKACVLRREQSIDDQVALRLDQMHWNSQRPIEDQIELLPADMEFDIELRLAAMDNKDDAA